MNIIFSISQPYITTNIQAAYSILPLINGYICHVKTLTVWEQKILLISQFRKFMSHEELLFSEEMPLNMVERGDIQHYIFHFLKIS